MKIDLLYILLISLRSFRPARMFDCYFDVLLLMLQFGLVGRAFNWFYENNI